MRKGRCFCFRQYSFHSHSCSYTTKLTNTKSTCHIQVTLVRPLRVCGLAKMTGIWQGGQGIRAGKWSLYLSWLGKMNCFLNVPFTFQGTSRVDSDCNIFIFSSVQSSWINFADLLLFVSPSLDVLWIKSCSLPSCHSLFTSSVLSFIFLVCSLRFWDLGNNLVSMPQSPSF